MNAFADLLPDPKLPSIPDVQTRHLFLRSHLTLAHAAGAVGVGASVSRRAAEPQRIHSVTASADPTIISNIIVQISIDGQGLLDTGAVSGQGTVFPKHHSVFPAGTTITSTVTSNLGVPTGPVNIVLEMESFLITPISEMTLVGRDRLFPSRQREAERTNQTIGLLRGDRSARRTVASIGQPRIRDPRPRPPITRREELAERNIAHRFRPR